MAGPEKGEIVEPRNLGGAPLGNKNAAHSKPLTDAIKRVLLADDAKKLRAFCESLVDRAIERDTTAANIILERIEGKVTQTLEHHGKDGEAIETNITVRFGGGGGGTVGGS